MNEIAAVLIAAAVHEAGHVTAALLTGAKIGGFGVDWRGPHLAIRIEPPCQWKAVANLMAGPGVNLLCGLAGGIFGIISLAMGLLNLILPGSDGMQALRLYRRSRGAVGGETGRSSTCVRRER